MRKDYLKARPEIARHLFAIGRELAAGPIEEDLRELLSVRISQINGCSFCISTHIAKAQAAGVSREKLDLLAQAGQLALFSPREKAALRLAEKLTRIEGDHIGDDEYVALRGDFSEEEFLDLAQLIALMNSWNRLSILYGYQPGD
jgi:uncharacterized peroxidase-related enzyme